MPDNKLSQSIDLNSRSKTRIAMSGVIVGAAIPSAVAAHLHSHSMNARRCPDSCSARRDQKGGEILFTQHVAHAEEGAEARPEGILWGVGVAESFVNVLAHVFGHVKAL